MKVVICGTEQVVSDNFDLSNKPWITKVNKKKVLRQGDKILIGNTQHIVTLIPCDVMDYCKGWKAFAISLSTGSRYDEGHHVYNEDWNAFPFPANWEE